MKIKKKFSPQKVERENKPKQRMRNTLIKNEEELIIIIIRIF